jgi:Gluconate 2-dehydrogenase subunit 3
VYNRREFLLQMTIVAMLPNSLKLFDQQIAPLSSPGFDKRDLQLLRAIMDEIVPAVDHMPAVTSVGGVEYLRFVGQEYPSIQEELKNFLTDLARASQAMFHASFEELHSGRRIQLLTELEKHSAAKLFGITKLITRNRVSSVSSPVN